MKSYTPFDLRVPVLPAPGPGYESHCWLCGQKFATGFAYAAHRDMDATPRVCHINKPRKSPV